VQTVSALRDRFPGAAILILTMVSNPNEVHLNLAAGARGYLLKEAAAEQVTGAIRKVAAGEEYLEPSLGAMMMRSAAEQEGRGGLPALSEREREVLRLVALGHTTAEIAALLQIAARTVEAHRAHIMQKLDLRSRAELVRFAVESGLVEFSSDS
jgi:DNA-binding NarL/FixJ family response regulator